MQTASNSTCVLYDNGAVVCWGSSDNLGVGADVTSPTVKPIVGTITRLATNNSGSHHCAIDDKGEALCWGSDERGQLGFEGASVDFSSDMTRITLW